MTDLSESKKDEYTIEAASQENGFVQGEPAGDSRGEPSGVGAAEEASVESATAGATGHDDDAAMLQAMMEQYEEAARKLTRGQIVEGKVVQVRDDEVIVDVGYKSEGRIPASELGLAEGQTPKDVLKEGDKVYVQVLRVDEDEGTVVVSKRRADERRAWEILTRKYEAKEP